MSNLHLVDSGYGTSFLLFDALILMPWFCGWLSSRWWIGEVWWWMSLAHWMPTSHGLETWKSPLVLGTIPRSVMKSPRLRNHKSASARFPPFGILLSFEWRIKILDCEYYAFSCSCSYGIHLTGWFCGLTLSSNEGTKRATFLPLAPFVTMWSGRWVRAYKRLAVTAD